MSGTNKLWRRAGIRALVVMSLLVVVIVGSRVLAQSDSLTIAWWTIGSGGGASRDASGLFAVQGTLGQPQAGVLSGGDYGLASGFWHASDARQTRPAGQQYLPFIQR